MNKLYVAFTCTTFITIIAGIWYMKHKQPLPAINDTIIVGTNAEFPPFSFIENDIIVGFDIDIAHEICKRLGKKMIIKNMAFSALIPEIQLGSIHLIAAGITPTPERAKRVFFTTPHLTSDPLVIITLAQKPLTVVDLKGKSVVVNQGYTADMYASSLEDITIIRLSTDSVSEGLLALKSGRADAFIAAKNSLLPFFDKHNNGVFQFTPIPGTQESDALAVSKHHKELYDQIQQTLNTMEKDGTLTTIKKKWGLL